jgi:type II secretory pathway predicted ATPase ExeA
MKTNATTPDTTHNDIPTSEAELSALGQSIETYRNDLGMPKATLLRDYPELGTDKTYSKILSGSTHDLNVEKWLAAYQTAWSHIQNTDVSEEATLLGQLTAPSELCRSYLECRNERSNARFILVLGDSGCGKTSAVQVMKAKPYGTAVHVIEAADVWRTSRGTAAPLLRAIAKELGLRDLPKTRDGLLEVVVDKLKGQRRCLVVDECHHLCPAGLNTLKTLINLTPVVIIATAMPVLWDKLAGSREAWAECKQLTGNRLAERIVLQLDVNEVAKYLAARLDGALSAEVIDKAAAHVLPLARGLGNLRFVDACTKRFIRESRRDQEPSLELWANSVALEKKKR